MKLRALLWLSAALVCRAAAVPSDEELRFWQERGDRDPADAFSPARLGSAFLARLRSTGASKWETKAEAAFRLALARDPGQHAALVSLSALCLRRHAFAEAERLASESIRLSPGSADGYGARGDARLELGRIDEAREDFSRAADLTPGLAARSRLAHLRWLEGHRDEACSLLAAALDDVSPGADPEAVAQVKLQLGELKFRSGDFGQARTLYAAAAGLLPGHPAATERLAELRGADGDLIGAKEMFEGCAERTGRPEYCQAVGDLLVAAGDHAGAGPWHDLALQGYLEAAEGGDRRYDHHLAGFYSDTRRDPASAVKWARRDHEQRRTVFTEDALAWALHQDGRREEAGQMMARALARGTEDAGLFFHAAMIRLAAGDKEAGRELLARAASVNPRYQAYHFHR